MARQISVQDRRFPDAVMIASSHLSIDELVFPEGYQGTRHQCRFSHVGHPVAFAQQHWAGSVFHVESDEIAWKATETKFNKLRERWYVERGAASSITEIAYCNAYLDIIALGPIAIRLILRRIEEEGTEPDMWFMALQRLTGADPVTDEIRGDFRAMAQRWLEWATDQGYAW